MGRPGVPAAVGQKFPVQLASCRLGLRGELLLQHRAEAFEQHQCLGPATRTRERLHHGPVHRLMQRVGSDDRRQQGHGSERVPFDQGVLDQLHDQCRAPLTDAVGMSLRPRLEGILGEQVPGPALERRGQRRPVLRRTGLVYGSLELLEVGDHVTIRSEHHKIGTHRQCGSPLHADCRQGPASRMHGLVQVVSCGVSVEVRPELVGELVPVQPMRRFQRQQLDQRLRLAQPPGAGGDRPVTLGDLETA